MHRVLLSTLVLFAVATPPAHAGDYQPATLQQAESIARAQWPGSPCEGREQVTVTDDLLTPNRGGEAEMTGTCVVRIKPNLAPYDLCVVLAHEYGHLAGYHGNDPADPVHDVSGLMAASVDETFAPCYPMLPPPEVWSPRQEAEMMFLPAKATCRLIKVRRRVRLYRCGVHRTIAVLMSADLKTVVNASEL